MRLFYTKPGFKKRLKSDFLGTLHVYNCILILRGRSVMTDKIRPLYDRLYIERLETEEKTKGGLYIPEGAKEKGQTGKVLAVGAGKWDQSGKMHPLQVKAGDVVFFGKYAGTDVDEKHLILREDEVLGVVER